MKKKGTGLRKKVFNIINNWYLKLYRIIVKKIYDKKDKNNFSGFPKLEKEYKKSIKNYWKKYNVKCNYHEFEFYQHYFPNIEKSPKYISKSIFHSYIEPYFNNVFTTEFCANKNYLDLILSNANLPKTFVRKINGVILDCNYEIISIKEAINIIKTSKSEMIYKPAVDSGGGRNILFIKNNIDENELIELLNGDDYIIQETIKQHRDLAFYNESSVNTVRVLSFLYKNEVHVLYMVLRVGEKGMRLDNASLGGVQVCIDKKGFFTDHIVTIDNKEVDANTKKMYVNKKMPFFDSILKEVKRLHPKLSVCGLVGWDITVDENGKPVIVEVNLQDIGMTDKSQSVNGPLFGEITDDVLNDVFK